MLGGHDPSYVHAVWIVASLIGMFAIGGLFIIYRRAARRHELEEAERILAEDDAAE